MYFEYVYEGFIIGGSLVKSKGIIGNAPGDGINGVSLNLLAMNIHVVRRSYLMNLSES